MSYSNMEMEMSEYIYANEPAEPQQMEETALNTPGEDDRAEEREVVIYEGSDYYEGHRAATPSAVKPGRTWVRAQTLCLLLLCVLLLAGIIGTGLHCRIKLQTHSESWAEERKQTLWGLSDFCKDGCTSFNFSFYYISSGKKSWDDSREDCRGRGADLVIVNSKEEQMFINSKNLVVWIGLTDREEEGTWRWVDGSVLNSTAFWRKGKPNGQHGGGMKCVDTYWYSEERSWSDEYCARQHHWICERMADF
ncbi:CD209 antigen-like protein E [Sparus aurata]|uniref:CD209 antigen-like protein E n=1 Tax=Sparus aurata TaxID=8175 RepID=UPI0011C13E48|nr:CD209 antigen-like protein E [Sparus aurata]